jgi:hypothetical protein
MAEKIKVIILSFFLLGMGMSAILSGEIPAHNSKGLTPLVTSFPNTQAYVPMVGWLLVLAGVYMITRTLYLWFKK